MGKSKFQLLVAVSFMVLVSGCNGTGGKSEDSSGALSAPSSNYAGSNTVNRDWYTDPNPEPTPTPTPPPAGVVVVTPPPAVAEYDIPVYTPRGPSISEFIFVSPNGSREPINASKIYWTVPDGVGAIYEFQRCTKDGSTLTNCQTILMVTCSNTTTCGASVYSAAYGSFATSYTARIVSTVVRQSDGSNKRTYKWTDSRADVGVDTRTTLRMRATYQDQASQDKYGNWANAMNCRGTSPITCSLKALGPVVVFPPL